MKTPKFVAMSLALFVIFGLTAFALQGQPQQQTMDHMEHSAPTQECAKACSDCQRACDQCATHCAHMLLEGKKEHLTTLATCRDCATVCSAAAHIAASGGPFAGLICESCAKACDKCAAACEAFPNDQLIRTCAEECRKCQMTCNAMKVAPIEVAPVKPAYKETPRNVRPVVKSTSVYSKEDKEVFQKKLESQIDEMDGRLTDLRERGRNLKGAAKDDWDQMMARLDVKQDAARAILDKLVQSSGDAWDKAKMDAEALWEDLSNDFRDASKKP